MSQCWKHGEMIGKVCMACQVEREHRTRSVMALVAMLLIMTFILYLLDR
jgi:hypothetical protein